MILTSAIQKLRLVFPCCNKRKDRQGVEIGGPTDVRRVDISDSLPGLTDAQRKNIREKASSDATRLLSLHSHPPMITTSPIVPNTPIPTPTTSPNPNHLGPRSVNTFTLQPSSVISFYEPSTPMTLLNAASKDEPSNVSIPPHFLHKEDDFPAIRMKSMWNSDKRYSSDSGGHDDILYETLPDVREVNEKNSDEPSKTLGFEFDWENKESGSDAAHSLGSIGASEMQDSADNEQELNNATSKQHA